MMMRGVVQCQFAFTMNTGGRERYSMKSISRFPHVSRIMSCDSHPETPKKVHKASESVTNAFNFVNEVETFLAPSEGKKRHPGNKASPKVRIPTENTTTTSE